MKRILSLILFLILICWSNLAFASKIPDKELQILQSQIPDLKVRFDGLIELPDGTDYIPFILCKRVKSLKM